MNTLQIHDVFQPYYAGRNRFFDHSEQPGKERDAKDRSQHEQPREQPAPDRRDA